MQIGKQVSKKVKVAFFSQRTEAVVCGCSSKLMFLKISQISHENTCVAVSFNKVASPISCNFGKKGPFSAEHLRWRLLK